MCTNTKTRFGKRGVVKKIKDRMSETMMSEIQRASCLLEKEKNQVPCPSQELCV